MENNTIAISNHEILEQEKTLEIIYLTLSFKEEDTKSQ